MAKGINEKIASIETPWNGYIGERIEEFIKEQFNQLNKQKMGYIHENSTEGVFNFYGSQQEYEEGKTPIGSVTSSARYTMDIQSDINNKSIFLSGDKNKEFVWYFKTIEIATDSLYAEDISVEYKISNETNSTDTVFSTKIDSNADINNKSYTKVVLKLDDYLTDGTSKIEINVKGLKTNQERTLSTKINIITLNMEDKTNFNSPFDNNFIVNTNITCTKSQTYSFEYRIDEQGDFIYSENLKKDGTGVEEKIDYTVNIANLSAGKHVFEYRIFVKIDAETEPYYTNIQRIEFIKSGNNVLNEPQILIFYSYNMNDVIKDENGDLIINGITQYVPYSLKYAIYNPNAGSTTVEFYEDFKEGANPSSTNVVSNNTFALYEIQSLTNGIKKITIITKDYDNNITNGSGRVIYFNIGESDLNIKLYNTNLRVDFSSVNKDNNSTDKNTWSSIVDNSGGAHYENHAIFNDTFDWSQGWTNNGLVVSDGCEVEFDYVPFPHQKDNATSEESNEYVGGDKAFTFEIEFMTQNVTNENTVVCNMMDETDGGKCGLLITGSEFKFTTPNGNSVSTRFKSNEMNRATVVIRPKRTNSGAFKGLVELYMNGILSNITKYTDGEKFEVFQKDEFGVSTPKKLSFKGSEGADIIIKYIRTYNGAMESDDVVNNYILFRTDSKEMINIYNKNNVINESGVITYESMNKIGNIPILIFVGRTVESELATGDGNKGDGEGNCNEEYEVGSINANEENWYETLEKTTNKKKNIDMDVIYYNPLDKTKNFKFVKAYITPQGTSSMYYPKKNYRIYTQKNKDTRVFLSTGEAGVLELDQMLKSNFGESEADRKYEFWRGTKNYKKRKYSFKDNAQAVKCWCLKADFAETSSSHNTGVARLWGDTLKNSTVTINNKPVSVFKTNAQSTTEANYKDDLKNMPDVRTTIDGFPIVVFGAKSYSGPFVFLGKYNFNNDKSTESVFGFCDIDKKHILTDQGKNTVTNEITNVEHTLNDMLDKYMCCVETLDNGNALANFSTMDNFDEKWEDAFEFRYMEIPEKPDEADYKDEHSNWKDKEGYEADLAEYEESIVEWNNTRLKPFKHFAQWVYDTRWCDVNGNILPELTEEEAMRRKEKFAIEKWQHLDVWKMAAYYIYAMRFGAVDQIVKNSMLTSEGPFACDKDGNKGGYWDTTPQEAPEYGQFYKWYYINYDNDTVMGVKNDGSLAYGPEITRKMKEGSGENASYIYAGSTSTLWNNFDTDEEFQNIVRLADQGISKYMTYKKAINMFDVEQVGKWCERIYNKDADYKYISPYIADWTYDGDDEEAVTFVDKLFMLQGARTAHRRWWLSRRFNLFDGKWNSGEFATKYVEVKCDYGSIGDTFRAVAGGNAYFGYQINGKTFGDGSEDGGTSFEHQSGDEINWKLYKNIQIGDPIAIYGSADLLELDLMGLSKNLSSVVFNFGDNADISNKLEKLILSIPDELLFTNSSYKIYSNDGEDVVNKKTSFEKLVSEYPYITIADFTNGTYPTSSVEFNASDKNAPEFYRTEIINEDGDVDYSYFAKVSIGIRNNSCNNISFDSLDKLQVLKMAGYVGLNTINLSNNSFVHTVDVRYSNIGNVTFAEGSRIKEFLASSSLTELKFTRCNNIKLSNIMIDSTTLKNNGGKNLITISVDNSDGLNHNNDFKNFIFKWMKGGDGYKTNSDKTLILKGVKWTGISISEIKNLMEFINGDEITGENRARLCNISGTFEMSNDNLSRENINLIERLKQIPGIDLVVKIPTNIVINLPESMVAGEEITIDSTLFPNKEEIEQNGGIVTYTIVKEVFEYVDSVLEDKNNGKYYEIVEKIDDFRNGGVSLKRKNNFEAILKTNETIEGEDTPLQIAAILSMGGIRRFDVSSIIIKDPTYAVMGNINGISQISEVNKEYIYDLTLTSNKNNEPIGTIEVSWNMFGFDGNHENGLDFIEYWEVTNDNRGLKFKTKENETPNRVAKFKMSATVNNLDVSGFDDLYIEKQITILNKEIILTDETNPVVLNVLKNNNIISQDSTSLTKEEASQIMSLGTSFSNINEEFTFEELEYFTKLETLNAGAFKNSKVSSIILPNNITELGVGVFENCSKLRNITLSENLIEIPQRAFLNCSSIENLVLPDNVLYIYANAFGGTNIEEMILLNTKSETNKVIFIGKDSKLTTIQNNAFEETTWNTSSITNKLVRAYLPSKLIIDESNYNFLLSPNLKEINVDEENNILSYENNVLYADINQSVLVRAIVDGEIIDVAHLDNVEEVYKYAFYNCGSIKNIIFGEKLKRYGLGIGAFYNSTIESISLLNSIYLEKLYEYTFNNMHVLYNVLLPENGELKTFGHNLFKNCPMLKTLVIPSTVTNIEVEKNNNAYTFVNCGLEELHMPEQMGANMSIRYIISTCSNLTKVTLGAFMQNTSENSVIENCNNLKEVTLPVFSYTNNEGEIVLNNRTLLCGNYSYISNCPLLTHYKLSKLDNRQYFIDDENGAIYQISDFTNNGFVNRDGYKVIAVPFTVNDSRKIIDDNVNAIGVGAFCKTQITSLNLHNRVTTIETEAFRECTKLVETIFMGDINVLPSHTFFNCSSLESLKFLGELNRIDSFAMCGCSNLRELVILSSVVPNIPENAIKTLSYKGNVEVSYNYHPFGYYDYNLVGTSSKVENKFYVPYDFRDGTNSNYDKEVYVIFNGNNLFNNTYYSTLEEAESIKESIGDPLLIVRNVGWVWKSPLLNPNLCGFKKETLKLNDTTNSKYVTIKIYKDGVEYTDGPIYLKSHSGEFVFKDVASSVKTSTYNVSEGGFRVMFDNDIYHNEPVYVYSDGECNNLLGEFNALYGINEYYVTNGKARTMSFKSTYFTETENKTDENEMANITKKEYETLLSRVNQMAELLNKLNK